MTDSTIHRAAAGLPVIPATPFSPSSTPPMTGLRAELGRGPVTVTTVVPGLMRTGSHLQARFTGQAGKEFTRGMSS